MQLAAESARPAADKAVLAAPSELAKAEAQVFGRNAGAARRPLSRPCSAPSSTRQAESFRTLVLISVASVFGAILTQPSAYGSRWTHDPVRGFACPPQWMPMFTTTVPDDTGSTKPAASDELVKTDTSAGGRVLSGALRPLPPPPPPKPPCATPIDFALVLDESGSMKKPRPTGSMEGPSGLKAFAKQLVSQYFLGVDAARFSVVSFAANATTRVPWSYNAAVINSGIDQMKADGKTSISDGFEAARQLFDDDGRVGATKIVLLVSDGEQTVDAAPGKTLVQTVVDSAMLVKGNGVTVFAWGFGSKVSLTTLKQIATDPSKAILAQDLVELKSSLGVLEAAVCKPPPPPSPVNLLHLNRD